MGNDSYITKSGSLKLRSWRYLSKSTSNIRYSSDVYDRIWIPLFMNEWTQISTTRDVFNSYKYVPSKDALKSAASPTNASEQLTIEWSSANSHDQYHLYAHFSELQDLQANETREFNMVWNGKHYYGPLTPPKLDLLTIFSKTPRTCDGGKCSVQLIRTNRSTLPPLLNAYEIFTVIQLQQSETDESDVSAIKSIADSYAFSRINWQGDPCFPQQLRWDGLNCTNANMSIPPRITSLDLSNNNLTGSLPQALQRRGLALSVEGNPRLCLSDPCKKPSKKKGAVPIVASVASAAIIIFVVVLYLVFRMKNPSILEGLHLLLGTSTVNATFSNKKSRRFRYSEFIKMTNNFQSILGEGGFGKVFHGTVNGSEHVAVKVLSQSSTQGCKEFKAEVDLLLKVHHKNLVKGIAMKEVNWPSSTSFCPMET